MAVSHPSTGFSLELLGYLVWGVVALVGGGIAARAKLRRKPTMNDATMLMAYYFDGRDVINLKTGTTPGGAYYNLLMSLDTGSADATVTKQEAAGVYCVQLPFVSGAHLLGIPKVAQVDQLDPSGRGSRMERIELEGDYPQYFSLYGDTNQGSNTQYVLDPTAMVFTIDFCSKVSWEISADSLYIVSSDSMPSLDVVDRFIREIRPAIEVASNAGTNPAKSSYGSFAGHVLKCPICSAVMVREKTWVSCPNHHGRLMGGADLIDVRNGAVSIDRNLADAPVQHKLIICPFCGTTMTPTAYQGSSTIIDVCSRCPNRWLDAGELAAK